VNKHILLILAHPAQSSLCRALAEAYRKGAAEVGHEVRFLALGELAFDPILHDGYSTLQPLEPDLVAAQEAINWAQHLVFVYPTWWGAIPALLKGFFDRVFLPGFAFGYRDNSPFWDRLLAGRSAHLLVTMDTPPWYYRWVFRMPGHCGARSLSSAASSRCG
jgi:NAD(P)H dehydrogenase (quinone)